MARRLGLVSMLGVPLHVKEDRVIGVLDCFTLSSHRFSNAEINLITTVASQAAIAIENTNLIVRTKIIEEELEKRKIVEKAKEILMAKKAFPRKSHSAGCRKSMDTRKSMKEIAEAIIIAQDI